LFSCSLLYSRHTAVGGKLAGSPPGPRLAHNAAKQRLFLFCEVHRIPVLAAGIDSHYAHHLAIELIQPTLHDRGSPYGHCPSLRTSECKEFGAPWEEPHCAKLSTSTVKEVGPPPCWKLT
jgi:hypothetical protein